MSFVHVEPWVLFRKRSRWWLSSDSAGLHTLFKDTVFSSYSLPLSNTYAVLFFLFQSSFPPKPSHLSPNPSVLGESGWEGSGVGTHDAVNCEHPVQTVSRDCDAIDKVKDLTVSRAWGCAPATLISAIDYRPPAVAAPDISIVRVQPPDLRQGVSSSVPLRTSDALLLAFIMRDMWWKAEGIWSKEVLSRASHNFVFFFGGIWGL